MHAPRRRPLSLIRTRLPDLRCRFGIGNVTLFGSVARDEARPASDVDVLVEFDGPATFDAYFGVQEALEELLGSRVDLATPEMLKPPPSSWRSSATASASRDPP